MNWIAKEQGFYRLPHRQSLKVSHPLTLKSVIIVFAIYLTMTTLVGALLSSLAQTLYRFNKTLPSLTILSGLQLLVIGGTLLLFYLYTRLLDSPLRQQIFKDRSNPNASSIGWDCCIGACTWILSFPLIMAVGQLTDMLLVYFAGFESYEQVAVRYLKMTLSSPSMLVVALVIILVAAPAIEELLFRGFLQTYFKRFMPIKWAIILSSLCFALFHFAPSQGLGNISLLASLFCFALFLGYIYERQASLFASFSLHVTFNTISTLRILFFSETGT